MNDQVTTVDPNEDLLEALDDTPKEELQAEEEPNEEVAEDAEEPKEDNEDKPTVYKLTVKNDKGEDEEKEVSIEELAKGYMLQADYTRKTQEVSSQKQKLDLQYSQALQEQQSQAVERINQLQELVLAQAAPELNGVDWVTLSVQDPAKFVQLQARQQQVQQTWQALEQQKAQHQQAKEQALGKAVSEVLKASDELLSREIPNLDGQKTSKLLDDIHRSVGWTRNDIQVAAKALASAGMHPGTLGQVLLLAHKAIQFDELQKSKPAALKKVADAPKIIKPSAPQPKQTNRAAVQRLKETGRLEDLARLL
jgi:hypothetical protein